MTIITNALTAITDKVTEITATYIESDPALVEARLAICDACEHYKLTICTQCGCCMPFKTKIKTASCPISKW